MHACGTPRTNIDLATCPSLLYAACGKTPLLRGCRRKAARKQGLTTRPISSSKLLSGPLRISQDINLPIGKMRDFGRPASHHGQFLIVQFAGVNAAQYSIVSFTPAN